MRWTWNELVIAVVIVTLTACIDVQSEVAQRKDVITGAISNRLPPDGIAAQDQSSRLEDTVTPFPDVPVNDLADLLLDGHELDGASDRLDQSGAGDLAEVDICQPNCDGLECGPDMCGGLCGFCPGDEVCALGQCKSCKPECTGLECGGDGCGGVCGVCPAKFACFSGLCTPPSCTGQEHIYGEAFDSCSQGDFGIFDGQPDDDVTWWGMPLNFKSEPCALYLGNPLTMTYETGSSVKVELLTTLVDLPGGQALQITFEILMLTEVLPSPLYPYNHDVLFLYFEPEGSAPQEVWSSKSILNDTQGMVLPVAVDISEFGGLSGRFRFLFDTLDSTDNDNPGIFLDDFQVASICPYCKVDEDCLDQDSCTLDSCLHFSNQPSIGTCYHEALLQCEPTEDPDEGP